MSSLRRPLFAFDGSVEHADTRTPERYKKQVETFLSKAKDVLVDRSVWDLYRHEPARLRLTVANPTDLGYTGVRLSVHLSGEVVSYPEELAKIADRDRPALPTAPEPLGTPTVEKRTFGIPTFDSYKLPSVINANQFFPRDPGYRITDTGSVTIDFSEFELRPGEMINLETVPLIVRESPGVTLAATWHATAAQVRGRLTGDFTVTTAESTYDLAAAAKD